MIIFPRCCACNWANHVSCTANVELVSDSAKFKMRSTKEGVVPVVSALILGIVIVGEEAWAVKGIAEPLAIKLYVLSNVMVCAAVKQIPTFV